MRWVIYKGDMIEAKVSGSYSSTELLGDLIARWSRDRDVGLWRDGTKMAAIARHYTDMGDSEVEGIFGVLPEDPGYGPWEMEHPDGGILTIRKE